MIGHDIHLGAPPDLRPAAGVPPTPCEEAPARVPETRRQEAMGGVPEVITDDTTEELPVRPSHSGKSKLPAIARLFGRWTTGGRFLSRSRMSGSDDDFSDVPREAWVSRAGIFVLAALFSFLVALAVLKLHRCSTTASRPAATTQVSATPGPQAPSAASAAPAALPAPSAPPSPPAAASHPPATTGPIEPKPQPQGARPNTTHRRARRAAPGASRKLGSQPTQPDRLTPATGQIGRDALLPLRI